MTTISCSADCKYQKDGKCTYEETLAKTVTISSNCAYFSPKFK